MRFVENDIPEFTPQTEDSIYQSLPAKRPSSARSEVRRFIKPLMETPAIRYSKVLRLKALVQSGKYETEEKISRTAELLVDLLVSIEPR